MVGSGGTRNAAVFRFTHNHSFALLRSGSFPVGLGAFLPVDDPYDADDYYYYYYDLFFTDDGIDDF